MQNKSKRHELLTGQIQRMDFLVEWEEYDPVSRSMGMRMVPDPRRYERRDVGGRTMYFDRFTNIAIAMLSLTPQQCLIATNPAFTVTIASFYQRALAHPAIDAIIAVLCCGPIVMATAGARL